MSKGRIIDKWVLNIEDKQVTIPVRMVAGEVTVFTVKYQYGEFEFDHSDSNIDTLKTKLVRWLQDIVTFKFETYYYIDFGGVTSGSLTDDDVRKIDTSLEWRTFDVGITADGMEMFRDRSKTQNDGEWTLGRPETGFILGSHRMLVPTTSENGDALIMLARAFDTLYMEMSQGFKVDIPEESFSLMVSKLSMLRGSDGGMGTDGT